MEITFYGAVILISLLVFFMKITAEVDPFIELILKTAGKIIPLFCILYSGLKLFKLLGVEI